MKDISYKLNEMKRNIDLIYQDQTRSIPIIQNLIEENIQIPVSSTLNQSKCLFVDSLKITAEYPSIFDNINFRESFIELNKLFTNVLKKFSNVFSLILIDEINEEGIIQQRKDLNQLEAFFKN